MALRAPRCARRARRTHPAVLGALGACCFVGTWGALSFTPWSTVEAAYDRISQNFAASRRFPWPFVAEWLAAPPRRPPSRQLVVAGCGDGRHVVSALEADRYGPIYALDLSQGMLTAARKRLGPELASQVTFLHADTRQLPLSASSVHDVLSCAVLHHLPLTETMCALREMSRVLLPGGRLLASTWDPRARQVAKRGRRAEDEDAFWVAWRCADGEDVQRWYHLPNLEKRLEAWKDVPGLVLKKAELDGDNQVFEWERAVDDLPT